MRLIPHSPGAPFLDTGASSIVFLGRAGWKYNNHMGHFVDGTNITYLCYIGICKHLVEDAS